MHCNPSLTEWQSSRPVPAGRRFEPQSGRFGAAAGGGAKIWQTSIEPMPANQESAALPLDRWPC